ncbi:multiple epidermal growth factor-like domains protein 10, partial [Saccostrea cucullata]|uniref:multiple epidermal growth factor-like domains protein 10 n=1 Tax=Saccostrea cuccullata TaxID=36930 RepID=UPI002ED5EE16
IRQRGRLAGFSLYVSNTTEINNSYLCYKGGPDLPPLDVINICTIHGRYIIFYNERCKDVSYPAGYETLFVTELCEVNVMGCDENSHYGQNCDLACPLHCQERRCNIINGTCLGCTAGWTGEFCNKTCMFGYYGMECKARCTGRCLGGASCHHISGRCERGCEEGWIFPNCDQPCQDGFYGRNCTYKCSGKCRNKLPCDKASGKCDSCAPGYIGHFCNDSCSKGNYGLNCSEICNIKCRGQNCFHENGFCTEGCEDGFHGTTCAESMLSTNARKDCMESTALDIAVLTARGKCVTMYMESVAMDVNQDGQVQTAVK